MINHSTINENIVKEIKLLNVIYTDLNFAIIVKRGARMHLLSRRIFNKSVTQPRCAFMGSKINWSRKALPLGNNREILNNYLEVDLTYLISA